MPSLIPLFPEKMIQIRNTWAFSDKLSKTDDKEVDE